MLSTFYNSGSHQIIPCIFAQLSTCLATGEAMLTVWCLNCNLEGDGCAPCQEIAKTCVYLQSFLRVGDNTDTREIIRGNVEEM